MKLFTAVFLAWACLGVSTIACADAPVWKVTHGDRVSYIGGTVHLLAPADHPLPEAFEQAYKQSKTLVFETDVDAASSPEFQTRMMHSMMAQDGEALKQTLKPDTYQKLSDYMEKSGSSIIQFAQFTPSGVCLVIAMMELQLMGLSPEWGVDVVYHKKAKLDGKKLAALETLEQQLSFFSNMGNGNDDELVLYTLNDVDKMKGYIEKLKKAWKIGDLKAIDAIVAQDKNKFPEMYNALITSRNKNWISKIEKMVKAEGTEFILFGAAHLSGEDGVIALLKKKGYTIEQM